MIVGIATGLGAALLQSLSYLATRYYVHGRDKFSFRQLLILGHVWMGVASGILLLFIWPRGFSPLQVIEPLLSMVLFYCIGQTSITLALRQVEASRASPIQGIKIIFLAALAAFFPLPKVGVLEPPGLTAMQWAGAILAVIAAAALNYAGKAIPRKALITILIGCSAYAIADWNISRTNVAIARVQPGLTSAQVSFLNACLCYGTTGLLALVTVPFWGSRKPKDWSAATPFAASWFVGMLFLYWCYAEAGPVLGVILQSTRGLMSILLGTLLAYWGHHHIEPHSHRGVVFRRLAAGILMFLAVSLYVIRTPGRLTIGWSHSSAEGTPWQAPHNLTAGTTF